MSKQYRKVENMLPEPFQPVLCFTEFDEVGWVSFYDDERWFEAHTNEPLYGVYIWMPIPLRSNE